MKQSVKCLQPDHSNQDVIGICVNSNCTQNRLFCNICLNSFHNNHFDDALIFQDLCEWINNQLISQSKINYLKQELQNVILLLSKSVKVFKSNNDLNQNSLPLNQLNQASEILQKLQETQNPRQSKIESISDQTLQEVTKSQNISRRFIYQKPKTPNTLTYTQELEKQNDLLKQRITKVAQARQIDTNQIQQEYNKIRVRVENLEKENSKLKQEYQKCYYELKEMKQEKEEEEKMRWHREAISDKNPYLMDEFRKKMDEKEKEIKRLAKSLKKFTILEKKLWVKEKAFEVERSEYLDRILYLSGRLGLTKIE